ncbi:MAG: galactose-1-phosphate uridylyltransferase, partial [Proteobacteria bacterium]
FSAPDLTTPTRLGNGACEVIVFTQNPDVSLGRLSLSEIELVLEVIGDRTREIGARLEVQYVLPFENRGVEVGVTLHHPHGQLYAYPFVPPVVQKMHEMQSQYFEKNKKTLMQNCVANEISDPRRMIHEGKQVVAFIPAFARYAYETWIVPKRPVSYLYELTSSELQEMAQTLKFLLLKFDKMWDKPFPYLMAIYQAPTDGKPHPEFHMHIQIYPALRTKEKLKFLAGTELGAGIFINDSLPEDKASELRKVEVEMPERTHS